MRLLHRIFAAFSVMAIGILAIGSGPPFFRLMGIVGYGVGAVVSVVVASLGNRPGARPDTHADDRPDTHADDRPDAHPDNRPDARHEQPGRRTTIVAHLALAPLQFVFSVGSSVTLAGIVISLLILARARPRFPRLSQRARRAWLVLHVGFSVGWLGVALTMTVLAVIGQLADAHAMRHGAYEVLHVVDPAVAIPSMGQSIVTGLVVSLGTKWGLVRYRWVLTKFTISVSIPIVAGGVENPLATDLGLRTADPAAQPDGTGFALTVCLAAFTTALWVATILSVTKPWGRTRWGNRALAAHPTNLVTAERKAPR